MAREAALGDALCPPEFDEGVEHIKAGKHYRSKLVYGGIRADVEGTSASAKYVTPGSDGDEDDTPSLPITRGMVLAMQLYNGSPAVLGIIHCKDTLYVVKWKSWAEAKISRPYAVRFPGFELKIPSSSGLDLFGLPRSTQEDDLNFWSERTPAPTFPIVNPPPVTTLLYNLPDIQSMPTLPSFDALRSPTP